MTTSPEQESKTHPTLAGALGTSSIPEMGKDSLVDLPGAGNSRWLLYFVAGFLIVFVPMALAWEEDGKARSLRWLCGALFFVCGTLSRQLGRLESHAREVAAIVDGLAVRSYGANYYAQRNTVTWLIEFLARIQEDASTRSEILTALQEVTGKSFGEDVTAWRLWWDAAQSTFQREESSNS